MSVFALSVCLLTLCVCVCVCVCVQRGIISLCVEDVAHHGPFHFKPTNDGAGRPLTCGFCQLCGCDDKVEAHRKSLFLSYQNEGV